MKTSTKSQLDDKIPAIKIDPVSLTLSNSSRQIQFTRREFQLFHFLYNNLGRTINKYILLDLIWDMGTFSTTNSLEVHLSNLRKKLTQISPHLNIITKRGVGYCLKCF